PPRPLTLSLHDALPISVFGDMEVSVLDELPPGRTPIVTTHAPSEDSATSDPEAAPWSLIRAQVADGRQAFVVCPLVSDSETKAADRKSTRLNSSHGSIS